MVMNELVGVGWGGVCVREMSVPVIQQVIVL